MSRTSISVLATLGVAFAAACGGMTDGASWQGTITDSAGVSIVANPEGGLWTEGDAWTFVEEFRVGGMDAAEEAQFGQVSGVDLDPEGNVYIADTQASQISVFDPDGAFLRTIGSPGAGPGEIGLALTGVWVKDGEIWAGDVANMRINRYSLEGELLGSEPLDFSRGIPIRWDRVGEAIVAQKRGLPGLGSDANPGGDPVVTEGQDPQDTVMVLGTGESIEMTEEAERRGLFPHSRPSSGSRWWAIQGRVRREPPHGPSISGAGMRTGCGASDGPERENVAFRVLEP